MIDTTSDHFRSTLYNINIYSMLLWSILGVYKFCQWVVNTILTHKYLYFCVLFPLCVCVYANWLSPLVVGYICTCWMKSTLLTVTVHQMFFIQHFVSRLCIYPFVCVCAGVCVCICVHVCEYKHSDRIKVHKQVFVFLYQLSYLAIISLFILSW